jgi:hypothetical protein
MPESNAVAGFLPSTHGLHFANSFAHGPTVRLGPLDPRLIGVGDAANGLCGGMAWFVRERFAAGLAIPPDTQAPANGSPLFKVLVRSQVKSLEWLRTPLGFWWIGAFGPDRTARQSRESQWPRIRATIDAGRLAMVGLVRHQGLNPFNLSKSHQVLGHGYEKEGDTFTLRIYDPNWPDRDDVAVVIEPNLIRQSTGEPLFGFLSLM